jgi:hypothetical protein
LSGQPLALDIRDPGSDDYGIGARVQGSAVSTEIARV